MIRQSTLDKWKPIIDGYDKKQCSLKEYCSMNNISQKSYTRNRLLIYGRHESKMDSAFLPAFIVPADFLVSSYRDFLKIDLTNLNYLPQFPVTHNTVFP